MKFLRIFETEQERQSVVSQLEYNTLSLANGVILIHHASGPGPIPVYDHYVGTINAEGDGSFKILSGGGCGQWEWIPARVAVDGVDLEVLSEYINLTAGTHTIEIWDDPNSEGYYNMCYLDGYFYNCAYNSMIIPDYITEIGCSAFYNCISITSFTIHNGITSIGTQAFYNCLGLTSVSIPNSVTSINGGAFSGCESLTVVNIPDSVIFMGGSAFFGCGSLTSVTCNAINPPQCENNSFDDTNDCPIYVPVSSVNAYKTATVWSEYASRIQAISSE